MTQAVLELLKTFETLQESEQQEAIIALLKRVQEMDYPPLDDETLAQIADETFLQYDADEAADRRG